MPHVSDGEIHGYLDGALDAFGADDASRIRSHLDRCDDCAVRLEQARDLRDRAEAILTGSDPAPVVAPPFEEIRRRAAADGARPQTGSRRLPPTSLAWAASVALALGTGWVLGNRVLDDSLSTPLGDVTGEVAAAEEAAPVPQVAQSRLESADADAATTDRSNDGGDRAGAGTVDQASEVAKTVAAPADQSTSGSRDQLGGAGREDQPVVAASAEPSSAADGQVVDSVVDLGAFRARGPAASRALLDEQASVASPARQAAVPAEPAQPGDALEQNQPDQVREGFADAELRASVVTEAEREEDRAAARSEQVVSGSSGLVVPGLPVESVAFDPDIGPAGGLRIVQRLSGGEALELVFVAGSENGLVESTRLSGAGLTESEAFPPVDGRSDLAQAVVARSGGWLAARAPVSNDSLAVLLGTIR